MKGDNDMAAEVEIPGTSRSTRRTTRIAGATATMMADDAFVTPAPGKRAGPKIQVGNFGIIGLLSTIQPGLRIRLRQRLTKDYQRPHSYANLNAERGKSTLTKPEKNRNYHLSSTPQPHFHEWITDCVRHEDC